MERSRGRDPQRASLVDRLIHRPLAGARGIRAACVIVLAAVIAGCSIG